MEYSINPQMTWNELVPPKDLHGTNVAAVSGQRLANLTKETLTKIPISDESFDHFYTNVGHRSEGLLDEPMLPRKQCTPAREEVGASAPGYPQIPKSPNLEEPTTDGFHVLTPPCPRNSIIVNPPPPL